MRDYTDVSTVLLSDERISNSAVFIYCFVKYLATQTDVKNVSIKKYNCYKAFCDRGSDGIECFEDYWHELEIFGYLKHIDGAEYQIFDIPKF